jgi:mono/diheme cytochrome c family protein
MTATTQQPRWLRRVRGLAQVLTSLLLGVAVVGCRHDMQDQPKYRPYRPSAFYDDGRSERPLVDGTVARGHLNDDALLYTGKVGTAPAEAFPFSVTAEVLQRGQERYNIYCSPCHGAAGYGDGMIVRRGYRRAASYHIDRLRTAPPGYFFDVITRGFGVMPDYAAQVPVRDRWAIVAYIRALQLSQRATLADVPPAEQRKLAAGETAPAQPAAAAGHAHD